jgi:hypothetical protein
LRGIITEKRGKWRGKCGATRIASEMLQTSDEAQLEYI